MGLVASFTPWYTGHKGAQEGKMGCQKAELAYLHGLVGEERWQLTELLTPQFSDWKRDKERSEEEKGQGSILYSVYSPTIHCPVSACLGKLSSISAA